MIQLKVAFDIAPARRAGFLASMREMMRDSQAEAGCLCYRFTADLDIATRFHPIEEWTSEEALQAHLRTPHFATFVQLLGQIDARRNSEARVGELVTYQLHRAVENA
jgi:quinol monooxygenase YgiN